MLPRQGYHLELFKVNTSLGTAAMVCCKVLDNYCQCTWTEEIMFDKLAGTHARIERPYK
jgi:hypothetical protein